MPQLDKATFVSQLVVTGILMVCFFSILSAAILPELYKVLRIRQFSFEEADWQIYVVGTLLELAHYTKRNSVDTVLPDAFEVLDGSELFVAQFYDNSLDSSIELLDEYSTEDELDLVSFVEEPTLDGLFDEYSIYYNFNVDYVSALAYSSVDCDFLEVDFVEEDV
jgi:hypothetical protein